MLVSVLTRELVAVLAVATLSLLLLELRPFDSGLPPLPLIGAFASLLLNPFPAFTTQLLLLSLRIGVGIMRKKRWERGTTPIFVVLGAKLLRRAI